MNEARLGMIALFTLAGVVVVAAAPATGPYPVPAHPPADVWRKLEPGLDLGTFAVNETHGDMHAQVHVLRIDPAKFRFTLLNASAPDEGTTKSAKDWCTKHGLVACVNAAMYGEDNRTSVSMMKTRSHVNNAKASADNALLVFDALDGKAPARILDRACDDGETAAKKYGTVVQSIRMIDCAGKNTWAPQPKRWSTAAIGTDTDGNVLFIHARDALPVHDLVEGLRSLAALHLSRLMYVEGGPEAQLFVSSGAETDEFLGSYETGFWENDDNHKAWPIPNVIGIERMAPLPAP